MDVVEALTKKLGLHFKLGELRDHPLLGSMT